jgi:sarcosine oxidase subunit gamma
VTADPRALADGFAEASRRSAGKLRLAADVGWNALNVRVEPAAAGPLAAVLGAELPTEPNTVASGRTGPLLWLGPDEWLVLTADDACEMAARLRACAGDTALSVVDVSAARVAVEVSGAAARSVLSHGCAIDLDPAVFPPGACAQTRLALANVVVVAPPGQSAAEFSSEPRFLILVSTSFSRYLRSWVLDAATEYLVVT